MMQNMNRQCVQCVNTAGLEEGIFTEQYNCSIMIEGLLFLF